MNKLLLVLAIIMYVTILGLFYAQVRLNYAQLRFAESVMDSLEGQSEFNKVQLDLNDQFINYIEQK